MANYNYECQRCGNVQEEFHPMSGPEKPIKCEECKSKKMKKCISLSNFSMKNSFKVKRRYNRD